MCHRTRTEASGTSPYAADFLAGRATARGLFDSLVSSLTSVRISRGVHPTCLTLTSAPLDQGVGIAAVAASL